MADPSIAEAEEPSKTSRCPIPAGWARDSPQTLDHLYSWCLSRVSHQHAMGRCKPEPKAHTASHHVGWVTPRSRHSTAPASSAPAGTHIGGSGPAPRLGSLTLSKRGSCEGRLGPHSAGSGGVYGAAAAGPPLVPRKAAAASDAASVRRHCGHGDTAGPGLGSWALRGSSLLHPRAPSPPRPARAHQAPSVTRGFHAALRRSRARVPPRPPPPYAALAATHFRPAPLRRGPAAPMSRDP